MANHRKDLTNIRFGKLVAIRIVDKDECGRMIWELVCDCGKKTTRTQSDLSKSIKKNKKSHCGCSPAAKTHGLTKSHRKLWMVYHSMKARCNRPSNKDFPNYGGRGIKVCDLWDETFENFALWADTSGYAEGLTIERVDVNSGYSPENCTWIENCRQSMNCRKTVMITNEGVTMCLSDWASKTGISNKTIKSRMARGWSIEKSLTCPVIKK